MIFCAWALTGGCQCRVTLCPGGLAQAGRAAGPANAAETKARAIASVVSFADRFMSTSQMLAWWLVDRSFSRRIFTMRWAALPSHKGGTLFVRREPLRTARDASIIRFGSFPPSWLLPYWMVEGLSVFSRRVKQGTPRAVHSSWTPPESVNTRLA